MSEGDLPRLDAIVTAATGQGVESIATDADVEVVDVDVDDGTAGFSWEVSSRQAPIARAAALRVIRIQRTVVSVGRPA